MASAIEERELSFTPAYKLVDMIRSKKLSPVELMEVTLKRIKEINPKLNAYLTVAHDEAMRAAQEAEQAVITGSNLGQLHGIPVSIKDLVITKNLRTTLGSLVYKDFVPENEGTMVQRLKAAGAIILGKTNAPEFGLCCSTENKLGDACRNPWNTERTSGGSSGGAAASVVAGISPLAQGSDGGGSTRIPASFCGVFGLKGSYGRVPKDVQPWGVSHVSSLDPITRNVRDAAPAITLLKNMKDKLSVLSFNANKIITTGQGGAVVGNDRYLESELRHLATTAKVGPYIHDRIGFNYRMSNINAAVGCAHANRSCNWGC